MAKQKRKAPEMTKKKSKKLKKVSGEEILQAPDTTPDKEEASLEVRPHHASVGEGGTEYTWGCLVSLKAITGHREVWVTVRLEYCHYLVSHHICRLLGKCPVLHGAVRH